jgi:hypothetical protein
MYAVFRIIPASVKAPVIPYGRPQKRPVRRKYSKATVKTQCPFLALPPGAVSDPKRSSASIC